jgi:cell division septation protein DedD
MKSNNVLTYVLFGLLGLFILAAGYYACEKQKREKALKAQEEAELQETLREMGYAEDDTTAASGSTFSAGDSSAAKTTTPAAKPGATTKTTVSKDGVEDETKSAKTTTTAAPQKLNSATKSSTTGTSTKKGASAVKGPGSGRWAVRVGTFAYMDGARRRLEEVIKAGYPNAEISKTKEGKAAVVVFRSNDKNAAIRIADQLEEKGFDAAVFDRN